MPSKFVEIVPSSNRQGNCIPFAAIQWHDFGNRPVLDTPFGKFARLQILTIEDLFAGKKPAMPPEDPAAFKRAAREEDKTRQGKADLANLTPLLDR